MTSSLRSEIFMDLRVIYERRDTLSGRPNLSTIGIFWYRTLQSIIDRNIVMLTALIP